MKRPYSELSRASASSSSSSSSPSTSFSAVSFGQRRLSRPSLGAKDHRALRESEEDVEDTLLALGAPSDTFAGVLLLLQRYRERCQLAQTAAVLRRRELEPPSRRTQTEAREVIKGCLDVPVTFSHHLYGVVKHRSSVDRELQQCCKDKQVRLLHVSTGLSDKAVVLEKDFRSLANRIADSLEILGKGSSSNSNDSSTPKGKTKARAALFRESCKIVKLFVANVLPHCRDLSISSADLRQLLFSSSLQSKEEFNRISFASGHKRPEAILCEQNLLIRRTDDFEADCYWFTIPRLGELVAVIKDARKLLVATIKRRRNHEFLQRDMLTLLTREGKKAKKTTSSRHKRGSGLFGKTAVSKSSSKGPVSNEKLAMATTLLGLDYHVTDLVESGLVRSIPTGLGALLKLSSNST